MNADAAGALLPGLFPSLLKLLRLRWKILCSSFRRAKGRTRIAYLSVGIMASMFAGVLLTAFTALLYLLRSPSFAKQVGDPTPFLEAFPSMALTIGGLMIVFTSFGVLLQTLYLARDMEFLMSTPTPVRAVFMAKMIQAVLPNFLILAVITLPALLGLGLSSGYRLLYYPCLILILTAVVVTAAAVASILVMVVARYFPPQRVAQTLGFGIALLFFSWSQLFGHIDTHFGVSSKPQLSVVRFLEYFNHPFSPVAWGGRGLVALGAGEPLSGLGLLTASLLVCGVVCGGAMLLSERLYYTGWAALRDQKKKTRPRGKKSDAVVSRSYNPFARLMTAPVRAILAKDLRLTIRDLSNLSNLIFPLMLGVFYAIGLVRNPGRMPAGHGRAPAALMNYGDIALALFLGWMLASNLAGLSFTREGKNYWMLKAAPVETRQLLTAKFLVGYLPAALVGSIYLLVLQILKRVDLWSALASMICLWVMLGGLTGIYLAFGTRGARFDWENPAERNRSVGCLSELSGMVFLAIGFALFVIPILLAQAFHLPAGVGRAAGLILCAAGNGFAIILPLQAVAKRVETLDEN